MSDDRQDHLPKSYRTPPFASASHVVPIGIHVASDGSLAFDPTDDALIADLRCMTAAFVEMYPEEELNRPGRFVNSVLGLALQKNELGEVMARILRQMAEGSGGAKEQYDINSMMASAFSRFPHFEDFHVLTAGCGDVAVDPEHPDYALSEELVFNFAGGRP